MYGYEWPVTDASKPNKSKIFRYNL